MAQRDYVSRERSGTAQRNAPNRKKSGSPKAPKTLVMLAVVLLIIFIGGLYFITHNKLEDAPLLPVHSNSTGNNLPPTPEERWHYIKELESRQTGVQLPTEPTAGGDASTKTQLTDEQRQLLEKIQLDMQQRPTQLPEVPYNDPLQPRNNSSQQQQQQSSNNGVHPQEQSTPPGNPSSNGAAIAPTPQQRPKQQTKQPEIVPVQTRPSEQKPMKPETVKQSSALEQKQKWMVQCGSFRATDQAESVKAQLAFGGIESRITSGGGWNRVVLGPYSSRSGADGVLTRLRGVGISSCIPLSVGG